MPESDRTRALIEPSSAAVIDPVPPPGPALNVFQRVVFKMLVGVLWIFRHLPDKPLYRSAFAIGAGLYLLLPERRAQVRSNLRRVCDWLVANDMANPRVARAVRDERTMDRLVRDAFGHWVLTYAEAAIGPRYSGAELDRRFDRSDPDATAESMAAQPQGQAGPIHMAMHFGAVDLSAMYGARVGDLPVTGPMELVESPFARAYFERARNELGVTIVPLENAAEALSGALERGEAVGVVADRNIVGRGSLVDLFGGPVRLPIGPAVLSVKTGAPIYLQAIERTGPGEWLGHTVRVRPEPGTARREATRSIIEREARAFESIVAHAPEQWTTLFFRIWEDEDGA
jgi:lauroyl/myristoyl acyltransferase